MLGFARRFLFLASLASAATIPLTGCTASVGGGDGSGGDGSGGDESSGDEGADLAALEEIGQVECSSYDGPCQPGDTYECGYPPAVATGECIVGPGCTTSWGTCYTPLVLSFDRGPVELVAGDQASFDLAGNVSIVTDWPTARTPWLAIDLDGDGRIGDGRELFGSMTRLPDGRTAANGFDALAALDANGDGRIDAADPGFAKLLLWGDADGDRASSPRELTPAGASLVSIELAYHRAPRCDARGNCEIERASFQYRDAAGTLRAGDVIDVHFRAQR
jgi:hypothetical protein